MKSSISNTLYILTASGLLLVIITSSHSAMADPAHCFSSGCYYLGFHAGALQANKDWNNNYSYDNTCSSGHSDQYCNGYSDGYSNWWNKASGDFTQAQSSGVNIHGNNNHIPVTQQEAVQSGSSSSGYSRSGSGDLLSCRLFCTLIK